MEQIPILRYHPHVFAVLIPLLTAVLIPLIGPFSEKLRNAIAVVGAMLTALFTLMLIPVIYPGTIPIEKAQEMVLIKGVFEWMPGLVSYDVMVDALSLFVTLIAGCVGALIVVFSLGYMHGEESQTRYYALVMMFIGSMIGMALSDSLLFLFIFWEMIGICSYALIGFYHKDLKAANAGMKAFITTKIGDFALLGGILLLYFAGPHTFSISRIASSLDRIPPEALYVASFLFIAGAVGKSAQVPLHVWLPDAMEAPSTISALIHAATLVNSGVYLIARMSNIFASIPSYFDWVLYIGAITAFLGALLAVVETDLKRALAYSTVSQLGYMMYALGLGATLAAHYHLVSHAIFKALLFLAAGAIIHSVHTRNMYEMGGLAKMPEMKTLHWTMSFGLLALAGIPVWNGFWSKDMIIASGFHRIFEHEPAGFLGGHTAFFYLLPYILALFGAMFTAAYSLKMYLLIFHGRPKFKTHLHAVAKTMEIPLMILAILTLLTWVPIGRMSTLIWNTMQVNEEFTPMGIGALLHHTFAGVPLYLTLLVIALGALLVVRRKKKIGDREVITYDGDHWPLAISTKILVNKEDRAQIYLAFRRRLGFDMLYYGFIDYVLIPFGNFVKQFFDGRIFDALNYGIAKLCLRFAGELRKTQTGDLNLNLSGLVWALTVVIFIIYWVNQW